jgi:hypothetical protein
LEEARDCAPLLLLAKASSDFSSCKYSWLRSTKEGGDSKGRPDPVEAAARQKKEQRRKAVATRNRVKELVRRGTW